MGEAHSAPGLAAALLASSLLGAGCQPDGPVFVAGSSPGPDRAVFWVTQLGERVDVTRVMPESSLRLDVAQFDQFFVVVFAESELKRLHPHAAADVIESVKLSPRPLTACTKDFSTGEPGRRGFPLADAKPEIRELDTESWTLGESLAPADALPGLAVDIALTPSCGAERPTLSDHRLPDVGRIDAGLPLEADRAAVINSQGELLLYELGANPRRLALTSRRLDDVGDYAVRSMAYCPEDGRRMLYLTDDFDSGGRVSRLTRFDLSTDSFDNAELLSNESVLDLTHQAPATCIGVGGNGVLVSTTTAAGFRTTLIGAEGLTFEAVHVVPNGGPAGGLIHVLAAADGGVYHGRVDQAQIVSLAHASAFGLRSIAGLVRSGVLEIWVTDSNERLHRLDAETLVAQHMRELERLPEELLGGCPGGFDECGNLVASHGVEHVAVVTKPDGVPRLVLALKDCPSLVVVDPETLCSYGVDLSGYSPPGREIRGVEARENRLWVALASGLVELAWP